MSQTRKTVRQRIREIINDNNPQERVVSTMRLHEIMDRNYETLMSRTLKNPVMQSVSVSAGTYDYTISTVFDILQVGRAFNATHNFELTWLAFDTFNSLFRPDIANAQTGDPTHYTLYPGIQTTGVGQIAKLRLGPIPDAAITVDLYMKYMEVLPTGDGSNLLLSETLLRALEASCVADIIMTLNDERLAKLGLSKASATMYLAQASEGIKIHNRKVADMGQRQDFTTRGFIQPVVRF